MLLGDEQVGGDVRGFFGRLFAPKSAGPVLPASVLGSQALRDLINRQRLGGVLIQAGQVVNAAKKRWGTDWRSKIGLLGNRSKFVTPDMQAALTAAAAVAHQAKQQAGR